MRIKLGKLLAVVLAACMTLSSVSLSALMDPDKLPSEGGELANYSYTLTEDIDLTGGYIVTHNVTIDLNGHTIKNVMEKTRQSDGDLTMFTVRNGAHLIINDSSADNSGTLDQNSKNDRTIRVDGNGYMDSSTNQWVNGAASSLTINGGQFVNSTDGAVYSNNGGNTVTLNGGTLKDNTTPGNGGAICVDGGGTFIMNGGTVDNNKSLRDANEDWGKIGGGGIYVLGNMTMSGGTVSNNTAGAGGGIFVNANWHDHGAPCDYIFKMSGGTVTGNVANKIEGGGIRIGWFVDAVFETDPGKIILIADNHTSSKTDWGGGGIFVSEDGKATMYDVLITGNTSDGFGGGLTGCPTAHNYVMSTDGAAIYGNTAKGVQGVTDSTKADSEAFESDVFKKDGNYQDYYCNLKSIISDTMLGGGSERWIGSIDFKSVEIGPGETRVSSETSGLTARPSDADKARAERLATIIIRDNTSATHGGGILNNGMLFFGERPDEGKGYVPTYFSIPVKKSITGADNLDITDKFTFNLELVSVVSKKTANDEVIGDVPFEAYKDSVTVVGAAEGRFKSIQFTDPEGELQVGASGYSDNYLTYTFEVREVEYQPAEGEPENQYEYTLDTTVWRVEADVIAEAIGDPDIESMFNVNRLLTVREIRLYKNDETLPADTVTNATHNGGTITADKGFIASFNNTLGTGDLKVEKKTVIENENGVENYETEDEFSFTVTLEPALNGTFGETDTAMTFENGVATFKLKNGEQKTATGLPIGVHYTVTEADNEKYSSEITGASGAIAKDTTATVTATNTVKTGSLSITKTLVGNAPGTDTKEFKFTVTGPDGYNDTVTVKGADTVTLNNLAIGEYTVTEQDANIDGYTLVVTGSGTTETVTVDKMAEFDITNEYTQKLGSLKITKKLAGDTNDDIENKTFTFTVTGPDGYNETVTIIGEGEETLNDLVPGEYTITEQDANIDGYTLEVSGDTTAKVTAEKVVNATITNTYHKLGSLKIVKSVEGGGEEAANKTFTFTVTGPDEFSKTVTIIGAGEAVLEDLVPGDYTVTENKTSAQISGYTLTVDGEGKATVSAEDVANVTIVNTYTQKLGSLSITKTLMGNAPGAEDKEFSFTVTGPDEFSKTVTIIGEGEETLNDLVPGEYTVTEQDANIDGYTLEVTGNGETKTVTADQVAEFDITNTYTQKPGSLKIVKSVVGGGDEAANKTFTFTVTGPNYSKTVTIIGEGEAVLENLVPGTYTVTEDTASAEVEGYTLSVTGEGKATVSAEDVANVTIVNTYTQKPGSLKIVKSVEGGGDEAANKTFTFTVTGPNYSKTVTITGNGYAELENLVPGDYTVTENKTSAQINGYTLAVTGEGKATVSAEDVANVTIVNTYTQKLGSLKIVKSVVGGGDDAASKTFTFTVTGPNYSKTVTIIGEGEAVLENLVPGTYTVTEDTASAEVEGYTLTVTGDNSTATIAADGNAEVTVTNNYTRKAGDLSVTKTLAGPVTDDDMAGSYNITVTLTNADGSPYSGNYTLSGADYEYSGPISLVFTGFTSDSKNKTIQISGLPVGTRYTVTETAVDETFNVSYTAVTGDGVVTADSVSGSITEALSMATVTNTKKETERFALNVTKTVEGAAPAEPFKFNVTFYIKTAEGITAPAGAVLGADGAGNITYAFEIPANTTVSFTGVPKGTYYEITEAPAEGYTLINQSLTSGTLLGNVEATFVNKENVRGSLSIVKELIGEGNALNAYNVNVTLTYPDERGVVSEVVTLTPGMPKIYEDLPVGTAFEVSETAESADGYNVSVSINGGGYVPGATATGTVTETAPVVSVAVRNEKEAPKESSLTVIKTVRGDNIDPTRAFNFTVTLTDTTINGVYGEMEFVNGVASFALAGGQSKSADKLPEGIGYTVKELDENLDGYTTEYPANATGILSSDSSAIVEVINTTSTLPGSLSVTKQVTGNGAEMGRTFMFTVMLNDPTITGQYGDMYFNGGVATIYLAHGMRATATGLPAGIGYNVIENDYGDYIPQAINPTGVIPDNGSAEVVYINHRDEQLGSLSVSKTVEGEGYDPEQEFTFTVTVNDPTVNGRYGDMFFSGGVATLTLKAGRTATATNLPADTGYTVTEAPVENYTSAATGDVGIIPAGNGAYAQFVNTYEAPKVGGFSLMKIVSGTAADPNRYFTFQVILSDATINGVYGDLAFADGFSTVFLRHGDIVYCDNLPEGTGYTVIELDADDYEVSCNAPAGTIVSGETGEIIFENHKDVPPPPPPPEIPENEENPHGDDMNAGVGGDRDRHGDDMNAGVGMDDMNPATGDFMSESFMNGMAMLSAIVAAIAAFGAAVLIRKRKKD